MTPALAVQSMRAAAKGAKLLLPAQLQALARMGMYALSRRAYRPSTVARTIFDASINVLIADAISEKWYDRDIGWLPSFKYLVEHRRQRYRSVFYIGAHHCVYGIALARALPGSTMLAVEANPEHSRAARANIELNGDLAVEVLTAAIADFEGELEFTYGHSVARGEAGVPTRRVAARTIDGLSREYGAPSLIILDVEGFEGRGLQGAAETLGSDADWCVEIHVGCGLERYGGSLGAVVDCFPPDRFDLQMSRDYGNSAVVPFAFDSPLVAGRFHLLALRR